MMRAAMMGASRADDDRPIMDGRELLAIAALDYDPRRPAPTTTTTTATTTTARPPRSRPSLVGQATADWFPHSPEEGVVGSAIVDDPLLPPDVLPPTTTATTTTTEEEGGEGGDGGNVSKMMEMMEIEGGETVPPLGMRWAKRFAHGEAGIRSAKEWVRRGVPAVLSGFPVIAFDPTDPPCPDMTVDVRDNDLWADYRTTLKGYLDFAVAADKTGEHRGLYAKDVPPPAEWEQHVRKHLHPSFLWKGEEDLMGTVPAYTQPESVMCYIGFHGTRTPAHKDIMGTLGHNVMLWGEKDAYALWMIAATSDRHKVADFFAATRQDLDADNGFVSPEEWARAPFPTYVIKQRVGDLVLVPAEAPHMVINQGGITCKFAWNRMAAQNLEIAINSALPTFRRNMKDEKYRAKLAAYYGLKDRATKVNAALAENRTPAQFLVEELPALLRVVERLIRDEWIDAEMVKTRHGLISDRLERSFAAPAVKKEKEEMGSNGKPKRQKVRRFTRERMVGDLPESVERLVNVQMFPDGEEPFLRTCDICKCDIFNLAFHRRTNIMRPAGDTSKAEDICLECMAEGASDANKYRREQYGLYQHIVRDEMIDMFASALSAYARATSPSSSAGDDSTSSSASTTATALTDAQQQPTAPAESGQVERNDDSSQQDAPPNSAAANPDTDAGGDHQTYWLRMAAMSRPELSTALQALGPDQPTVATRAAIQSMQLWLKKGLQSLPVVCHECRNSRSADFPELLVRCSCCYKVFCKNCVVRRHNVDFEALAEEALSKQEWTCFACKGTCLCSICAPGAWSASRSPRLPTNRAAKRPSVSSQDALPSSEDQEVAIALQNEEVSATSGRRRSSRESKPSSRLVQELEIHCNWQPASSPNGGGRRTRSAKAAKLEVPKVEQPKEAEQSEAVVFEYGGDVYRCADTRVRTLLELQRRTVEDKSVFQTLLAHALQAKLVELQSRTTSRKARPDRRTETEAATATTTSTAETAKTAVKKTNTKKRKRGATKTSTKRTNNKKAHAKTSTKRADSDDDYNEAEAEAEEEEEAQEEEEENEEEMEIEESEDECEYQPSTKRRQTPSVVARRRNSRTIKVEEEEEEEEEEVTKVEKAEDVVEVEVETMEIVDDCSSTSESQGVEVKPAEVTPDSPAETTASRPKRKAAEMARALSADVVGRRSSRNSRGSRNAAVPVTRQSAEEDTANSSDAKGIEEGSDLGVADIFDRLGPVEVAKLGFEQATLDEWAARDAIPLEHRLLVRGRLTRSRKNIWDTLTDKQLRILSDDDKPPVRRLQMRRRSKIDSARSLSTAATAAATSTEADDATRDSQPAHQTDEVDKAEAQGKKNNDEQEKGEEEQVEEEEKAKAKTSKKKRVAKRTLSALPVPSKRKSLDRDCGSAMDAGDVGAQASASAPPCAVLLISDDDDDESREEQDESWQEPDEAYVCPDEDEDEVEETDTANIPSPLL